MIDSFSRRAFSRRAMVRVQVILAWFRRPIRIQRSLEESRLLAKQTSTMALYDYKWCPDSLKARHEIHHLNIEIERRDIQNCPVHQDNLLSQFGQLKAPCLRVEENGMVQWLDEPDAIVHYLHDRFGEPAARLSI